MTINDLRYFAQVCHYGSFSKAANALYLSQQALSSRIKGLEGELRHQLFFRNQNGVTVTPFGRDFLLQTKQVLEEFDKLEKYGDTYSADKNAALSIGLRDQGKVPYMVYRLADHYKAEHEGVSFYFQSMDQELLLRRLMLEEIDLAVILSSEYTEYIDDQYFDKYQLSRRIIRLCVNEKNPLASRQDITWADLKGESFFLPEEGNVYTQSIIERCREYGFYPNASICSSDTTMPLMVVADNAAIAFLPDYMIRRDNLQANGVVIREIRPVLTMDYLLVAKRNRRKTAFLRDFIEYTQKNIDNFFS